MSGTSPNPIDKPETGSPQRSDRRFSARTRAIPTPTRRILWIPALLGACMMIAGIIMLVPWRAQVSLHYPAVDRSLPTIVVDAGHGGNDKGAVDNGLREKDLTLDVALRLERKLRQRGFAVVMTRRNDSFPSLEERTKIANRIPNALFVSVHFNHSENTKATGIETFFATEKIAGEPQWSLASMFTKPVPSPTDGGAAFAQAVQNSVVQRLGSLDRGAKPQKLHVVRRTRCPAILVEGGFLSNPSEARTIAREEYREDLADAIVDGLLRYYFSTPAGNPDLRYTYQQPLPTKRG